MQLSKDRSSDLLKISVLNLLRWEKLPEIPDVCFRQAYSKRKKARRDSFHFLNEASKVIPQMEVDNDYKETLCKNS